MNIVPAAQEGVVLVGGGRNAHNLLGLLESSGVRIACILDDYVKASILGYKVTPVDQYAGPEWASIMTIADPDVRQRVIERASLKKCIWTSYIDSRSVISSHAKIGCGALIFPFVMCTDAEIGDQVTLFPSSVVGARAKIGDFSCISPHATIASDVEIGRACVIGMGARISAGVRIGDNCRIAPNAYVRKNLPDGMLATSIGAPLRVVRRSK